MNVLSQFWRCDAGGRSEARESALFPGGPRLRGLIPTSLAEKRLQISPSLPSIHPVPPPSHPKFANDFVEVMATVLLANSYASAFHTQTRPCPWTPSSIPPS